MRSAPRPIFSHFALFLSRASVFLSEPAVASCRCDSADLVGRSFFVTTRRIRHDAQLALKRFLTVPASVYSEPAR